MVINNSRLSPAYKNPFEFSVWCVLEKLSAHTRN